MKHIFVRPAEPKDTEKFLEWSKLNPDADLTSGLYPDSFTLCAFNEEGPVAFLPVQQPQILEPMLIEALAVKPDASELDVTAAIKELIQACITFGYLKKTGEVYFLGTNERTNALAERQGLFKKLPWPVYRLRLSDLVKE